MMGHNARNDLFQVFIFMLTGRMVIDWQLKRRQDEVTANGDAKQKKQD